MKALFYCIQVSAENAVKTKHKFNALILYASSFIIRDISV